MNKKRIMPLVLSVAMASQPVAILANELQNVDTSKGSLKIDMSLSMPTPNNEFNVNLISNDNDSKTTTLKKSESENKLTAEINDITPGLYTLQISSKNYATYTKQIQIDASYITNISLDNSRNNYTANLKNPKGVMAIGDINNDGLIDDNDSNTLIDAIESNSANKEFDLNGDNFIDVTDLSYIAINKGGNTDTKLVKIVNPKAIIPNISENTQIKEGNIENILENDNTSVVLAPANENSPIDENNPVNIELEVNTAVSSDGLVITPPSGSQNLITNGMVTLTDDTGVEYQVQITKPDSKGMTLLSNNGATATIEADGSIVINVGKQIAIKRVSINVTGSSSNLVDIAKVEFVNGMENRIPAPNLNIPTITKLEAKGDSAFIVEWNPETNVSSYEVSVNGQIFQTLETNIVINDVNGEDVTSGITYTVMVRSVNGEWKSPFSEAKTIKLSPTSVPEKPESITVTGGNESIDVSWKKMKHTESYNVYYKLEEEAEYQVINGIKGTSHKIINLIPEKTYNVYVTAVNEIGESQPSDINKATVKSSNATILPKYKLINTGDTVGALTDNIKSVTNSADSNVTVFGGENAIVDNDPSTYVFVDHYDGGVFYASPKGSIIELNKAYKFDTIRFAPHPDYTPYDTAKIRYKNEEGNMVEANVKSITKQFDKNRSIYYDVKLQTPITTDTFQLNVGIWYPGCKIAISEIKIYEYDSLENDINGLFADEMHLTLKPEVNENTLLELENRLNTPDSVSGEYHPYKENLQKEITAARAILEGNASSQIFNVNTSITAKNDGHLDFAMPLSDLQPLGITATEGEKVTLYVGSAGVPDGTPVDLKLYATQVHGESNKWIEDLGQLKTGKNEITITSPSSTSNERGGSLYVAYTGKKDAKQYSIRLENERNMPVLDITREDITIMNDVALEKTIKYVENLENHVNNLETKHNEKHTEHDFDSRSCTLNVTDIVMDNMMYSFPATQVLSALKGETTEEKAEQLLQSLRAMEQQIDFFYQHKGLNKNVDDTNKYPSQRLNIRYSTMFSGAFMYAAGKHIGIEYDSVPGLFKMTPIQSDEKGKYISGNYSGWGIAHEIGHVINSNKYVNGEVTNNYFSMLAQAKESNKTARIKYNDVYKHVTSGKIGKASDVFTQLAMYWQLHMFYDNYYNYKTFDTYEEQFNNLFFARVDSYVRNPKSAPNGLVLNSDSDNNFIRLACAAANKNLLPFFESWGLVANEETKAYANQFEIENTKIQYLDDDSRAYRLEGNEGMSTGTKVTSNIDYVNNSKQVTINFSNSNTNDNAMLGYEIIRNGKVIAFVTANETNYVDTIKTENNRVYEYKVIGYDRLLNKTEISNAGIVKVSHDGSIGKDNWTVSTNMVSVDDEHIEANDDSGYCENTTISAIKNVIDDNYENSYVGLAENNAEIIIDFNNVEQVTALKYSTLSPTNDNYSIYVSKDKNDWQLVKQGTFSGQTQETIYFNKDNDPLMYIYDASYMKLVIDNSNISFSEIDILGPTGDNIDFFTPQDEQQVSIGRLSDNFQYGINPEDVINAGTIVVTGKYKGNPAYNIVLLKDENGNIINTDTQLLLAEVPENGNIGEVSSGTFIYALDESNLPQKVKAELYRVDNAETLEGQRFVSDTMFMNLPSEIPPLKIESTVKPVILETNKIEEIKTEDNNENEVSNEPVKDEIDNINNENENNKNESNENESNNDEKPIENNQLVSYSNIDDTDLLFTASENSVTLSSNIALEQNNNKSQAIIKLNNNGDNFIAIQTQMKVSNPEKIANVEMAWSDSTNKAILKECKFNKENGTISLYVVSNEFLSSGEEFNFGTLTINSNTSSKQSFELNVDTTKTILVSETFERNVGDEIASNITVESQGNSSSSGSGSSGSSSSGSSNSGSSNSGSSSSNSNQSKPEQKPEEPQKPEITPSIVPPKTEAADVFADLNTNSWYYNSVNKAYKNNWFAGVTENSFAPDNNMTRAMLVTVLGRFDKAHILPTPTQFTDVPADMYYANYVGWAKNNGIVSGITETTFEPNTDITREQLAVMICNYLKFKNVDLSNAINTTPFTDSENISSWASESVNIIKALGIINGRTDGSFDPKGTATRAEIATILSNIDDMNIIK